MRNRFGSLSLDLSLGMGSLSSSGENSCTGYWQIQEFCGHAGRSTKMIYPALSRQQTA